jgi:uncharacterized membrane protein YeiH
MEPTALFSLLDFLGIFAGAVDGALETIRGRRVEYDAVGVTGLALAAALGGGMTRDVLLGRGAPLALTNPMYLAVALSGAVLTLLFHSRLGKGTAKAILIVDAAALGLFSVAGSTRALDAQMTLLPAILLGVVTAAGGGAWRDVLSGCPPRVFLRGQLYVIVALCASAVFIIASALGLPRGIAAPLGIGTGFVFRILTLKFNWRTRAVQPND